MRPIKSFARLQDGSSLMIKLTGRNREGRVTASYVVLPVRATWIYTNYDMTSGVGADESQQTCDGLLDTLVAFLLACAEAGPFSENRDLFPSHVRDWAIEHSDELQLIGIGADE